MKTSRRWMQAIAAAGVLSLAGSALADGRPGCDYGGGYGGGDYGGPGMMQGWGGGPGMMSGWGGGPGMMGGWAGERGGWGMGPGARRGAGPGYGMGAGYAFEGLDLTADQRSKLREIQKGVRTRHWGLMARMMEARFKLDELYDADVLDKSAIDAQYKEMDDARRQMIDSSIDARNQMRELLTKEQRDRLGQVGPGRGAMMR